MEFDKSYSVLKYLYKNPLFGFALVIIFTAILVSILGANIRPDGTLHSNTQIPQISRLKPGTTISFLKVRKNKEIDKSNFFEKLFFGGQESFYTFIPYDKYELKDNYILLHEYDLNRGEPNYVPNKLTFTFDDILFNLNDKASKNREGIKELVWSNHLIEKTFFLGTDKHGRDLLSRLMAGTIISLSIGLISVLISFFLGLTRYFGLLWG